MVQMLDFEIFVSHSQVYVFDGGLTRPFNMWTSRHVSQGFAWRTNSVGFRTLAESGLHQVVVDLHSVEREWLSSAQRIIEVPFEVLGKGEVEVGGIGDTRWAVMNPGSYQLTYQCHKAKFDGKPLIMFSFYPARNPRFRILRADADLSVVEPLLEEANEA